MGNTNIENEIKKGLIHRSCFYLKNKWFHIIDKISKSESYRKRNFTFSIEIVIRNRLSNNLERGERS